MQLDHPSPRFLQKYQQSNKDVSPASKERIEQLVANFQTINKITAQFHQNHKQHLSLPKIACANEHNNSKIYEENEPNFDKQAISPSKMIQSLPCEFDLQLMKDFNTETSFNPIGGSQQEGGGFNSNKSGKSQNQQAGDQQKMAVWNLPRIQQADSKGSSNENNHQEDLKKQIFKMLANDLQTTRKKKTHSPNAILREKKKQAIALFKHPPIQQLLHKEVEQFSTYIDNIGDTPCSSVHTIKVNSNNNKNKNYYQQLNSKSSSLNHHNRSKQISPQKLQENYQILVNQGKYSQNNNSSFLKDRLLQLSGKRNKEKVSNTNPNNSKLLFIDLDNTSKMISNNNRSQIQVKEGRSNSNFINDKLENYISICNKSRIHKSNQQLLNNNNNKGSNSNQLLELIKNNFENNNVNFIASQATNNTQNNCNYPLYSAKVIERSRIKSMTDIPQSLLLQSDITQQIQFNSQNINCKFKLNAYVQTQFKATDQQTLPSETQSQSSKASNPIIISKNPLIGESSPQITSAKSSLHLPHTTKSVATGNSILPYINTSTYTMNSAYRNSLISAISTSRQGSVGSNPDSQIQNINSHRKNQSTHQVQIQGSSQHNSLHNQQVKQQISYEGQICPTIITLTRNNSQEDKYRNHNFINMCNKNSLKHKSNSQIHKVNDLLQLQQQKQQSQQSQQLPYPQAQPQIQTQAQPQSQQHLEQISQQNKDYHSQTSLRSSSPKIQKEIKSPSQKKVKKQQEYKLQKSLEEEEDEEIRDIALDEDQYIKNREVSTPLLPWQLQSIRNQFLKTYKTEGNNNPKSSDVSSPKKKKRKASNMKIVDKQRITQFEEFDINDYCSRNAQIS